MTGYWGKWIRIRRLNLHCDQPGCLGTRQTTGRKSGDGATPGESGFRLVGLQVGVVPTQRDSELKLSVSVSRVAGPVLNPLRELSD